MDQLSSGSHVSGRVWQKFRSNCRTKWYVEKDGSRQLAQSHRIGIGAHRAGEYMVDYAFENGQELATSLELHSEF